jgi:hypothetical protein
MQCITTVTAQHTAKTKTLRGDLNPSATIAIAMMSPGKDKRYAIVTTKNREIMKFDLYANAY